MLCFQQWVAIYTRDWNGCAAGSPLLLPQRLGPLFEQGLNASETAAKLLNS